MWPVTVQGTSTEEPAEPTPKVVIPEAEPARLSGIHHLRKKQDEASMSAPVLNPPQVMGSGLRFAAPE
jgi:hypothetical protein